MTLKLQRIQHIEGYIKKYGSVSLDELCQRFEVSKNTIRRDLQELEARRLIKKVYGGVMLNNAEAPIPLSQRQMTMTAEKTAIARKAAEFVHDGDIIVIDAGSTTVHLVESIKDRHNITIITNSVPVLNAALGYEHCHLIVTGGDLLRPTNSFVGQDAVSLLKKLNAKTVFLAATGVSLNKGITNSSTIETEIKKTMIDVSAQRILLVDHTKFDTISLVTFADLKDLHIVITDQLPPPQYIQYCAQCRVEVIVANP
jgi:DeoR family myo-inositol catabolism operon transcriptional repressor